MAGNRPLNHLRNYLIELALYATVVIAYFFVVLRYLGNWLNALYFENIVLYAFLCLGLIVVQGIFLDLVTSFLLNHLRLDRFD